MTAEFLRDLARGQSVPTAHNHLGMDDPISWGMDAVRQFAYLALFGPIMWWAGSKVFGHGTPPRPYSPAHFIPLLRNNALILQQQILGASAQIVAASGACLMEAPPAGPVEHRVWWGQDAHDQAVDKPTDFWDGERDQGAVRREFSHERPPLRAVPGMRDRTTAR